MSDLATVVEAGKAAVVDAIRQEQAETEQEAAVTAALPGLLSLAEAEIRLRAASVSLPADIQQNYGMDDLLEAFEVLPRVAQTTRDILGRIEKDARYTERGKQDARARQFADSVRELGNVEARLRGSQEQDDENLRALERTAREEIVPRDDFTRAKCLLLATRVSESGKTPAERITMVNRGSLELKRAVLFVGAEACGLDPDYVTGNLRTQVETTDLRQARADHQLRTARRDRVLGQIRSVRETLVDVSDSDYLSRVGAIGKLGRKMTHQERFVYLKKHGQFPRYY